MHDLNTINKLNAQQFAEWAEGLRGEGKHVLVTYEGLHVVGLESFTDRDEAFAKLNEAQGAATAGQHFKMMLPAKDGQAAVDIEAARPQLLDGEPDDPVLPPTAGNTVEGQPELTEAELAELGMAADARDRALTALQAAALAFAKLQGECDVLAGKLRQKMEERGRQLNLIN